jgi:MoxR-like ATPase
MTPTEFRGRHALPEAGSWPASVHVFDEQQRHALLAAQATGRPLLIRGEPGTGKSQLAHAAAAVQRRRFISFVVDSRTEPSDLLYRYDAVARLADAQIARTGADDEASAARDPRRYVTPGPLWWAFDWSGAKEWLDKSRVKSLPPAAPDWTVAADLGPVVLIDEIDKAEAEVPNGLLEALGNGRFAIPFASHVVEQSKSAPKPLVIITSNDERELPAAFLRRCFVLTLQMPPPGLTLKDHLVDIAQAHFKAWAGANAELVLSCAQMLEEDRAKAARLGVYKPGMAEFLDLLLALQGIEGDPKDIVEKLRGFVFSKQPGAD